MTSARVIGKRIRNKAQTTCLYRSSPGRESLHEPKFDFSDTLECKPSMSKMKPLSKILLSHTLLVPWSGSRLVPTPETIESKMIKNLLLKMPHGISPKY